MTKNPDIRLINKIKNKNCSESIKILRDQHIGIMAKTYSKYSGVLSNYNFTNDDFKNEVDLIIYNAAKSYNPRKKTKFSSYLCNNTRFFCLNKINELNKHKEIGHESEKLEFLIDSCVNKDNNDVDNSNLCDYLFHLLEQFTDQRAKEIFRMRFFEGNGNKMTFNEIAARMNPPLSAQHCINIYNKTIEVLRKKLECHNTNDNI